MANSSSNTGNNNNNNNVKLSSLLISQIRTFLISYRDEMKNKKFTTTPFSSSSSLTKTLNPFSSNVFGVPDPTTANALQTSTVVLRKKNSKKKNSPLDGVPLSNYRLRPKEIRAEVFDWICHYLWLKNCPIELATIVANKISVKMSQEFSKECSGNELMANHYHEQQQQQQQQQNNDESDNDKPSALVDSAPNIDGISVDVPSISLDTLCQFMDQRSSLPSALCSHDVARQSREMVDEYLDELGSNLDQAVSIVNEYLDSSSKDKASVFTSSIHAIKNRRQSMEDRHVIIHNLNKALNLDLPNTYSYYAIFDGHAGVDAASYSTAHLHHYLVESQAFRNGQIEEAFREAFKKTDSLYIKRLKEDGVDKLKPSGTTALCALIENNKTVYLAWAGDSQAVLVRNGCHEEIMLPHKPDMESERIRIQDQGGFVIYLDTWRVNGILSVTRAIGDPEHKALIIAEPSFSTFEIDSSLDFLVLGCDGLFDHLNGQDITCHVFEYICKNENNDPEKVIQGVSAYLSDMAVNEGSSDNITSIVIFFKPFEQLVSTGFPAAANENQDITCGQESSGGHTTTLPTTNGGHFPYTDFAELPIGTNYKLTSEEFIDSICTQQPTLLPESLDTSNLVNMSPMVESLSNRKLQNDFVQRENLEENTIVCEVEDGEDLGEDCQDEFDFVRTSHMDDDNKQVSQQSEENNQQVVTEKEQKQELDIQSSMITVDKPATPIVETLLDSKTDDDGIELATNNNNNLAVEQTFLIDEQHSNKYDESVTNENRVEEKPINDVLEKASEILLEQEKPIVNIIDNGNNPFMDLTTTGVSPNTTNDEQVTIMDSSLNMNDDIKSALSNEFIENPLQTLECVPSVTFENDVSKSPTITTDYQFNQQDTLTTAFETNPSNNDFVNFVDLAINESNTLLYPVENSENTCSMISPMLLNDVQLESGLLYDQQNGAIIDNDSNHPNENQKLFDFQPENFNKDALSYDQTVQIDTNDLKELEKSNTMNDFILDITNKTDMNEKFDHKNWMNIDDDNISSYSVKNGKGIGSELIESVNIMENSEVLEKTHQPEENIDFNVEVAVTSDSRLVNEKNPNNDQSNDTSSKLLTENILSDYLPKQNEELSCNTSLIDEKKINHEENDFEKSKAISFVAANIENEVHEIMDKSSVHNSEMLQTDLVSKPVPELLIDDDISNKESVPEKSTELVEKIETEIESVEAEVLKTEPNVNVKETVPPVSKTNKLPKTAARIPLITKTTATNKTPQSIGTKSTIRTTGTSGNVPKVSTTRPMINTVSSRLTTVKPSTATTGKVNSTTSMKTDVKKPATSVASKLNTRPITISSTSRTTSTITRSSTTGTAASKPRTTLSGSTSNSVKSSTMKTITKEPKPTVNSTNTSLVASKNTRSTADVPKRPGIRLSVGAQPKTTMTTTKKPATETTNSAVSSKVGSLRTAGTVAKTQTSVNKPTTLRSSTTTAKVLSKPAGINSTVKKATTKLDNTHNETKKTTSKFSNNNKTTNILNGTQPSMTAKVKPLTHKRTNIISLENSLKRELEDAVMNEMNNAAATALARINSIGNAK